MLADPDYPFIHACRRDTKDEPLLKQQMMLYTFSVDNNVDSYLNLHHEQGLEGVNK